MSAVRISKVKFKSGGEITILPESMDNISRVQLDGWGEVVFRAYDGRRLTVSDCSYMADMAKMKVSTAP